MLPTMGIIAAGGGGPLCSGCKAITPLKDRVTDSPGLRVILEDPVFQCLFSSSKSGMRLAPFILKLIALR